MKKILPVLALGASSWLQAQNVGIGTPAPHASAKLEISDAGRGVLIPRLALSATNVAAPVAAPAVSLLVYNTATAGTGATAVTPGFYYWDGSRWVRMATGTNDDWATLGNTGTVSGTNFLGTTDNQALDIRTNNVLRTRITTKGQIEVLNTGASVFVGEGAGANDDLTLKGGVFLGYQAGNANTSGMGNTATGYQSLFSNTTGQLNTATGLMSLYANETGEHNTANGTQALFFNTTGSGNTAMGSGTLYTNINGSNNTAIGREAMNKNQFGLQNTAIGYRAMYESVGVSVLLNAQGWFASYNTAVGYGALHNNAQGRRNTGVGHNVLFNTMGEENVGMGANTLQWNVGGMGATAVGTRAMQYANNAAVNFMQDNVAFGFEALRGSSTPANNTGAGNTALGFQTLTANTSGGGNVAVGAYTLSSNTFGTDNVGLGLQSLFSNIGGTGNTALGRQSLYSNTSGNNAVAIGRNALYSNTTGSGNIAVGQQALYFNTTGFNSIAIGGNALYSNTTGSGNIALGNSALYSNTAGFNNVALGQEALTANTSGQQNTAAGPFALRENTTGIRNTASGINALRENTTGWDNTGHGANALGLNTTGSSNTAVGSSALNNNTTAGANTAVGYRAMLNTTTGAGNTAMGSDAMHVNTTGFENTALGYRNLESNSTGTHNSSVGSFALFNTTGGQNTALGANAGIGNTTGTLNTFIGRSANASVGTLTNATAIGANAVVSQSNSLILGNNANVGIGTSTPAEALSVSFAKAGWQSRFNNSSGTGADVYLAHGGGYGMHLRGWNANDAIYTLEMYNNTTITNAFYNSGRVALGLVGNVGIGIATPGWGTKLHVVGNAAFTATTAVFDANTRAAYIRGVNGYSTAATPNYTWYNSDQTGMFHPAANTIGFCTNSGGEVMRISGANVGIGCTAPAYKLHVIGDIASSATVRSTTAVVTGAIAACSDARYKTQVINLSGTLATVLAMRPVSYLWRVEEFPQKHFSEQTQIGFIAQEVEALLPQLVHTDSEDGYKSVDYGRLTPVLVGAVQEQQALIEQLRLENQALRNELNQLQHLKTEVSAIQTEMKALRDLLNTKK